MHCWSKGGADWDSGPRRAPRAEVALATDAQVRLLPGVCPVYCLKVLNCHKIMQYIYKGGGPQRETFSTFFFEKQQQQKEINKQA